MEEKNLPDNVKVCDINSLPEVKMIEITTYYTREEAEFMGLIDKK